MTLWERGQAAWPELGQSAERFVEHLARCVPPELSTSTALGTLHAEDLFLACGCARGDHRAIALFHRRYMPAITRALAKVRADEALAAEVRQAVTVQLFVGDAQTPPKIATYRGQGDLASWLQVTVVRAAVKQLHRRRRERPLEDVLAGAVAGRDEVELAQFKRACGGLFTAALRAALARLGERERTLLRRHYLERCSIQELARALGVHRVTVSRWLEEARARLLAQTKAEVMARAGVGVAECDSMLALARSQIDMSLGALRVEEA